MKSIISLIFLICIISFTSKAQDIIFPGLPGFRIKADYPVFTSDNLYDFIDGAADIYLSYGFVNLNVAEYKKGKDVIKVEIYRHKNHTMSFGIYSSERSPSLRFLNLGAQGYISGGIINFFKGNYYVKIKTFSKKEKIIQTAESLALKISLMLEGESIMPSMIQQFPQEGKNQFEETYINNNVLGHNFLNNAFKATYTIGPDSFSVFIIQEASVEDTNKTVNTFLASAGIDPVEENEGKYVINDGYNGTVFLAWANSRIVIISGLARDQADIADKYTSGILR